MSVELAVPPTPADIDDAAEALRGVVVRTPVVRSAELDEAVGGSVVAKLESLQVTGSFKVRGALNRIRTLSAEQRDRGLITVSAGNAALGAAFAARRLRCPLTVVMPEGAVPAKVAAVRRLGATVVKDGVSDATVAFARATTLQHDGGLTFVHPFDDPFVVAGAATATVEFLEDDPELERLIVPCSGGGLLSGAALAVAASGRDIDVIGVQPSGADVLARALRTDSPPAPRPIKTIADGLTAPGPGVLNFAIIRSAGVRVVVVDDDEIRTAMRDIAQLLRIVVEPAAAVVAAALTRYSELRGPGRTGLLISGSNVQPSLLADALQLPARS